MDPQQFRQIVKAELEPVKKNLNELSDDVNILKKDVQEIKENVDAARGDIEQLHLDVKGIRDDIGLKHQRDKREIDEIKTHLGLPLMSDAP